MVHLPPAKLSVATEGARLRAGCAGLVRPLALLLRLETPCRLSLGDLGAGSALLSFLTLIGCGCFLLEIPELRKRRKETEKGHLATGSEVLALKTAQPRGVYRWNTARLRMVRWRGQCRFCEGSHFPDSDAQTCPNRVWQVGKDLLLHLDYMGAGMNECLP